MFFLGCLRIVCSAGKADPYVVVTLPRSGLRYSTSVKHNTLDPVWNEEACDCVGDGVMGDGSNLQIKLWFTR